ncbi:MAG: Holliday junction resolvase RuvX [Bacteroidota bacterium]
MGRIVAIDYGTRRTGIAVTDPEKIIATGLTTVPSHELLKYLEKYISENVVECFVVGDPKQMNNLASESAKAVNDFVKQLQKKFNSIPVKRIDERFTSKMAIQSIRDSGLKKSDRQNKELVDMVSATILLQSYMQSSSKQ